MIWKYIESIKKQNEINRKTLAINQRIKIKRVVQDCSMMGGYAVVYDDYRYRCEDFAAITDILCWIEYGEVCVDNFILISMQFKD